MSANVATNRCSSLIAERAEKVFMTQMEIIRLKYPRTLHMLQSGEVCMVLSLEYSKHFKSFKNFRQIEAQLHKDKY